MLLMVIHAVLTLLCNGLVFFFLTLQAWRCHCQWRARRGAWLEVQQSRRLLSSCLSGWLDLMRHSQQQEGVADGHRKGRQLERVLVAWHWDYVMQVRGKVKRQRLIN